MLQILLLILKILGILLLVILGIILAVLLIVLFVPVRYRGDVSFDGKPRGGVMVSWLLHLVTVRVDYDGSVKALVKVLWFRLFDKTVWPAEEIDEAGDELETDISVGEVSGAKKTVVDVQSAGISDSKNPVVENKGENISGSAVHVESVKETSGEQVHAMEVGVPKAEKQERHKAQQPVAEKAESVVKKPATEKAESTAKNVEAENKSKLEAILDKIASVVRTFVSKVTGTYKQINGKIQDGQKKIDKVRTFLADTENQNTIKLLWGQVKKLFKHVLPRKINGRIRFGFDDPSTTGQILTYISPFYGLYAKSVDIEPVFDEKVMEGELHLKGHIRVASLIWIVVRVFLNKNFRHLLKTWRSRSK